MSKGRFRLVKDLKGTADGHGEALRQAFGVENSKDCDKSEIDRMQQLIQKLKGMEGNGYAD